jgi:DNA-binding beta-propeller fold protein YncE
MNRKQVSAATAIGLALGAVWTLTSDGVFGQSPQSLQVPKFQYDPTFPQPLPENWSIGAIGGMAVDSHDHIWVLHRPTPLQKNERLGGAAMTPPRAECCIPAPPVLEFDQDGKLLASWGGPGEGYDWPETNHGIFIDYKGNVWIGGNGRPAPGTPASTGRGAAAGRAGRGTPGNESQPAPGYFNDNMILKFTQQGKFLMQIGKPGQSKGSNDVDNVKGAAKMFVDPKTNELYVADGYGNHRVIVFDAETGKYKRHWGAYGNKPDDTPLGRYDPTAAPAQQFRNPVHCAELSHDGLLYVCDRPNDRIQVFKPDGTFVKEVFVKKNTLGDGSVWDIAFSKDPEQKYIYLADGSNEKVYIIQRDTMEILTSFGDGGRQPGEFYAVHSIATDSKGNIFTTETYRGQRIQKFLYKGLAAVTKKDQGVVWPKSTKN